MTQKNRLISVSLLFLIILSVVVRLFNITSPFLIHSFRQSQNAIMVWTFLEEGLAPFTAQLPIFGPPWRLPMEFPTFQITAFFVAKIGWADIDASCRITGLLYYLLSAVLLYFFCVAVFREKRVSWCVLLFYLWSPYMLFWSRTSMIDYASVAWSLGYALLFYQWLQKTDSVLLALSTVFVGCLAYLTKITTMAAYVVPIGWFILRHFRTKGKNVRGLITYVQEKKYVFVYTLCCVFVPVITGYAWVVFSDYVKASSPFTAPWVSANIADWNFGTWDQRMNLSNWWKIINITYSQLIPYGFLILPVAGLAGLRKYSENKKGLFIASLAGAFLPIAVFFNLYKVHTYYLIAITPFAAIIAGVGADYILGHQIFRRPLIIALVLLIGTASFYKGTWFFRTILSSSETPPLYQVGKAVQRLTVPGEYVAVADSTWDSTILFYARRKGFMLHRPHDNFTYRFLKENNFTIVVCKKEYPALFSAWKHRKLLDTVAGFKIYRVFDNSLNNLNNT